MILTEEALKDARAQGASDDQILEAYKSSAPQHAKEIESGLKSGAKPGELLGSLSEFYKTQPQTAPAAGGEEGFFGGIANDFREGLAGGLKGAAKTAEVYAGPGAISGTLGAASDVVAPEGRRQSFAQRYKDTTFKKDGISGLAGLAPGLIANSLGDLAPALAGGAIGSVAGPAGAMAGFTGVRAGQSAGDIAQSRATNNGTAEPSTTDKVVGAGAGVALGALDRLGLGKAIGSTATKTGMAVVPQILSQTAKATGQGALTGAVSSAGQQAAGSLGTDKGLQVDPSAVGEAAALGGAAAGGIRAARGVGDVGRAVKFRDLDPTEIARYNARIDETRGATDSPEASAKVLSQVESRLSAETTALSRDVSKQLKSTNPGVDTDTIAAKITEAKATLKKGIELEPKFLEDLARDIEGTNSGPKLLEVLKDFNTHAKVQSKGRVQGEGSDQRFVGGMSSVPGLGALLDPMVALKRYRNTVLTGGGATGLGVYSMPQLASMAAGPAAAATGGLLAAGQTLKVVDKATGYRNPLDSLRKLKDPKASTSDIAPAESFATQKAREAQALKEARVAQAKTNADERVTTRMEQEIGKAVQGDQKARVRVKTETEKSWKQFQDDEARKAAEADKAFDSNTQDPKLKAKQEDAAWSQYEKQRADDADLSIQASEAIRESTMQRLSSLLARGEKAKAQELEARIAKDKAWEAYRRQQDQAAKADQSKASDFDKAEKARVTQETKAPDATRQAQEDAAYAELAKQQRVVQDWTDTDAIAGINEAILKDGKIRIRGQKAVDRFKARQAAKTAAEEKASKEASGATEAPKATGGARKPRKPPTGTSEAPRATPEAEAAPTATQATGAQGTFSHNGFDFDIPKDVRVSPSRYAEGIRRNQDTIKKGLEKILGERTNSDGEILAYNAYQRMAKARTGTLAESYLKDIIREAKLKPKDQLDILAKYNKEIRPVFSKD